MTRSGDLLNHMTSDQGGNWNIQAQPRQLRDEEIACCQPCIRVSSNPCPSKDFDRGLPRPRNGRH